MDANLVGLAIVLIVIMAGDAILCVPPIPPIKADLDRLKVTRPIQRLIPVVKFLAVGGLLVGLWIPWVGVLAAVGLVAYFVVALTYHQRANDAPVRYLPAVAVGTFSAVVGVASYLTAI